MKRTFLSLLLCSLLLLTIAGAASASEINVKGSIYFKCKLRSTYMEKHGYYFLEEIMNREFSKSNSYAAGNADITIRNDRNEVLASGMTDSKGHFFFAVPESTHYTLVVRFHDREAMKRVSAAEVETVNMDLGYFSTEKVGEWIDARLDWN